MGAIPFFDPERDEIPPFDPKDAPPFDYDAPHDRVVLSPLALSKGVKPNGMIPGDEPTLDPSRAGDAWSTNQLTDSEGIEKHYVLPTLPGDKPPSGDGIELGDAAKRFQQTGEHYGAFDTDERAAEFMRSHKRGLLDSLATAGESEGLAAQTSIFSKGVSGAAKAAFGTQPIAGFGKEGEELHNKVYENLKAIGIDTSKPGLVQGAASILYNGLADLDQLTKAGLDVSSRATNAAIAGIGATVAETLQFSGMERDEARRAGDAISSLAESEMLRNMSEVHPEGNAAIGRKGLINQYEDVLPVNPAQPTLPGLINSRLSEDPRFQRSGAPDAPPLYSALENALEGKNPEIKVQEKAPPDQWLNTIKGWKGIKVDELEQVLLKEFLNDKKAQGVKSVSRQEILDHVKAHNVEIEEVVLGGTNFKVWREINDLEQQKHDILNQQKADFAAKDRELIDAGRWQEANEHLATAKEAEAQAQTKVQDIDNQISALRPRLKNPPAQYEGYAHPGDEYQIHLQVLKRPDASAKIDALEQASDNAYDKLITEYMRAGGLTRSQAVRGLYGAQDGSMLNHDLNQLRAAVPDADRLLAETEQTYKAYHQAINTKPEPFDRSHWPHIKDVIGHYRTVLVRDPGTGEVHPVVVEMQSDWLQKLKQIGVKGVVDTPEAQTAAREALGQAKTTFDKEQTRLVHEISGNYADKDDLFQHGTDDEKREFQRREIDDEDYRKSEQANEEAQENMLKARGFHPKGRPVPDAPFKSTPAWTTLLTKQILRWAADMNYKKVYFDVGATNVDRYKSYLVHEVETLRYEPLPDGRFSVQAINADGDRIGVKELSGTFTAGKVADIYGKGIAREMVEREGYRDTQGNYVNYDPDEPDAHEFGVEYDLDSIGQTHGSQGMLDYYDKVAQNAINDYVKKWKTKLNMDSIPHNPEKWQIIDPDPAYGETEWELRDQHGNSELYDSKEEAENELSYKLDTIPARSLEIPDKLREDVLTKGQPRFQRRGGAEGAVLPPGAEAIPYAGGKVELVYTPGMEAKREAVAQAARARLDALNLHDVGVHVVDAIHELGAGGQRVSQPAMYWQNVITVAMQDDPLSAVNHEVIHALKALDASSPSGLFKPSEWAMLEREAEKTWNAEHDIAGKYPGQSPAYQSEEGIAFAFPKWLKDGVPQGIQHLVSRLQDFFQAIKNAFKGEGFHTVDSIFRKIESGEIGGRESGAHDRGLINADAASFQRTSAPDSATVFYSALERFVEASKQDKAPAAQWLGFLKSDNAKLAKVKPDEIEWRELNDWFAQRAGQKVTKQEILDHLRSNQIEFKEIYRGAADPKLLAEYKQLEDEARGLHDENGRLRMSGLFTDADRFAAKATPRLHEINNRLRDIDTEIRNTPRAPYAQTYSLHGGTEPRELLMLLPHRDVPIDVMDNRYLGDFHGKFRLWDNRTNDYYDRTPYDNRRDAQDAADALTGKPDVLNFRGMHMLEPNILAHIRFDVRTDPMTGKRYIHLAEMQSDWHNEGEQLGLRSVKQNNISGALIKAGEARDQALTRLEQARTQIVKDASGGTYTTTTDLLMKGTADQIQAFHDLDANAPELLAARKAFDEASVNYQRARYGGGHVANAPFPDTWNELVLKRMMRYAAEHGYDGISWDTAQTQLTRYPTYGAQRARMEKRFANIYDKRAIWFMNDYAKKAGAKVKSADLPINKEGWHITPPDQTTHGQWMVKNNNYMSYGMRFDTEAEAKAYLDTKIEKVPVHRIDFTDKLREAVMQPMPMFKRAQGLINANPR
jgi:hypothetical protein